MKIIKIRKFGESVELSPTDIEKLFYFAQNFDIFEGKPSGEFVFDVRMWKAIHWLHPTTRRILSSLYRDETSNKVIIVGGTDENSSWDVDTANKKWTELLNEASRLVILKKS